MDQALPEERALVRGDAAGEPSGDLPCADRGHCKACCCWDYEGRVGGGGGWRQELEMRRNIIMVLLLQVVQQGGGGG